MLAATSDAASRWRRGLLLLCVVCASELVYGLPYQLTKYMRPTFLQAFECTNLDIGKAKAWFGLAAMLSYFPGGLLADRYPPRRMLAAALLGTAAGGLYLATFPGPAGLALLWGWWGLTCTLLLWCSAIRAATELGGSGGEGRALGLLEGGRGALELLITAGMVWLLIRRLPAAGLPAAELLLGRRAAMRVLILGYTALTAAAAAVCWLGMTDASPAERDSKDEPPALWAHVPAVLRRATTWVQIAVVVCAYLASISADVFALYAIEVYGLGEADSAWLAALYSVFRPIGALCAGWAADRCHSALAAAALYAVLIVAMAALAAAPDAGGGRGASVAVVGAMVCAAAFACNGLRGVYFTLLREGSCPAEHTGTATGVVSAAGFTPDIFGSLLVGALLDASPGPRGHRNLFGAMVAVGLCGLLASLVFWRVTDGGATVGVDRGRAYVLVAPAAHPTAAP
jgi:sugar phosphate permease